VTVFLAGLDADSILSAVLDETRSEVRGGEDALVAVVFGLGKNRKQSRFRNSVEAYVERLLSDEPYLAALRRLWKERAATDQKLPTNDVLRELLGE